MILETYCVKCYSVTVHMGSPPDGPFECARCGYRWNINHGRQVDDVPNRKEST